MLNIISALLCTTHLISAVLAGDEYPTSAYPCYRSFYGTWEVYNWCVSGDTWDAYPKPTLTELPGIRGSDIVSRLQDYCSRSAEIRECVMNDVSACNDDVISTQREALDKSMAVCDGNGGLRGEIVQVLSSENPASDEETKTDVCHNGIDYWDCMNEINEKMGNPHENIIFQKLKDIIANDAYTYYYNTLFHCAYDKISLNCPNNAVTMSVALYPRVVLYPRIGVNVSTILLSLTPSS